MKQQLPDIEHVAPGSDPGEKGNRPALQVPEPTAWGACPSSRAQCLVTPVPYSFVSVFLIFFFSIIVCCYAFKFSDFLFCSIKAAVYPIQLIFYLI